MEKPLLLHPLFERESAKIDKMDEALELRKKTSVKIWK
ncbi:hypothetical protein EVA_11575 [gut metagenome]|uniref:Uncharacterized protein n=1 Tax=gut metagenome TaxID=749906 RepID=J9GKW0_9ZZZZ